jgi:hypothetical protein
MTAARRRLRTSAAFVLLATDRRIPTWLRVLFVIGCVQIPVLPIDEIALCLAVGILLVFHRPLLVEAWTRTAAGVTT